MGAPTKQIPKAAYSIRETCAAFGVSKDWLRRQIAAGHIKAVKLGGRVFIPLSEIERFGRGEIGGPVAPKVTKRADPVAVRVEESPVVHITPTIRIEESPERVIKVEAHVEESPPERVVKLKMKPGMPRPWRGEK